jgi:integrase
MSAAGNKTRHRGVNIRKRPNAGGSVSYRVECPLAWFSRVAFRQFKTKAKAEGFIDGQLNDRRRLGSLANALTSEERLDAAKAIELLESSSASLIDCAEFYLKHNKPPQGDISFGELLESFLEARKAGLGAKKGQPLRSRSLGDLRARLGKFKATFGPQLVKDITTDEIESWLHREEWSLQTRQNYYRVLHTFFDYAKTKGYRADNPLTGISKPCPDDAAPGVLSVVQCEKLLSAALDTDSSLGLLGYVVLGMYCGIRSAELERLDWSAVDLESRHVTISAKIAKARSIRNTDISDNAINWLMQCQKRTGDIRPPQWRERFDKLRETAGITQWPPNALRHSAGSYHFALHEDSAKTASMLGHTQDAVLFKHYRALTKKADAARFYGLLPKDKDKRKIVIGINQEMNG